MAYSFIADYPHAKVMAVPDNWPFLNRSGYTGPLSVVVHKTASPGNAEDIARFFHNDTGGMKSVHYIVGRDGEIVQCVSEKDGAGGNGILDPGHDPFWDHTGVSDPNLCTISIEHVDNDPNNATPVTAAQKAASFALIGEICRRHNIPPARIFEHRSLQPINRARCPGNYPMDELRQHVATVLAGSETAGVPHGWSDDGTTLTAPNGHKVVRGFRDYVLNNAWKAENVPLGEAYDANPIEQSNPQNGAGTRQDFRYTALGQTQRLGVYLIPLGDEFNWYKDALAKAQQSSPPLPAT
ncbi:MAG TPA: peptidoglycan recognition family protein [Ktedonobacteraceae bacterium]|nr:peptidoglycan recognition family protein [Ktedonobacteraceae bacterium]